jgi:hypothetical protein
MPSLLKHHGIEMVNPGAVQARELTTLGADGHAIEVAPAAQHFIECPQHKPT